ncbi:MAG: asparagine synthase (glutamine-hydrolyzing) [Pseudomonadota bacterium]|nr:asparagine synthase (glutamine-hydrolyzing) [Pseudomonadota bacterium]
MCGIAGLMTRDGSSPNRSMLDTMLHALGHRGPDGEGLHISQGVGLAHNRLAIIDLMTGNQPLHEPRGTTLIANAEIYNYIELRQDLPGVQFATQSDCEPPLHLYQKHGINFAKKLRGMYAIAIYDAVKKRLVLSRDRFGIKPLYYCESDKYFAFASEPRALLAAGLATREVNEAQRNELLQLQFTCGRQTIFSIIQRVMPGETLVVNAGRIAERRQLEMLPKAIEPTQSFASLDNAIETLDKTLEESVRVHQRSDVPYGLFLSGGIDSSTVLALMARLNERPISAFTVGFSDSKVHDEREHAKAVASAVGAKHHEVEFNENDFWDLLPQVAASLDDPVADYAVLPTWKLAREAAQDLKVVLSGEGGDELFAGYGRYRSHLRPWWLGGRTLRARGIFDGLNVLREESNAWRKAFKTSQTGAETEGRSPLQIAQAADCANWLPNDLLTKLDRCLMAHSLEGRTPFLDHKVAKVAFQLPDDLKIRKGVGKWLLRQWLQRILPAALPFERKRGFTVPVGEWIHRRGSKLGPLVAHHPAIVEFCQPHHVEKMFLAKHKRAGIASWVLLFYALWHQTAISGTSVEGDVFDVLAETK